MARIDRPMFVWGTGEMSDSVTRIFVYVFLPRYFIESRRELGKAIQQNKSVIDRMVQAKVEKELLSQKLSVPFCSFAQTKCTLRPDYILEYLFDLKSAA